MPDFPVAPFPQAPSGNNPYAGAATSAMGASSSAANGLINALNSAANQKADQDYRAEQAKIAQGHQDQKDHFQAAQDGWLDVPQASQSPQAAPPGMPTLQRPSTADGPPATGITGTTPSTPRIDPSRIVQIGGGPMYKPTLQEGLNDSNSFTLDDGTVDDLHKAGLTNIRAGVRYSKSEMDGLNERLAAYHRENDKPPETFTYNSKDYVDENGKPVLVAQGDRGTMKIADLSQLHGQSAPSTPGAQNGGPYDTAALEAPPAGDTSSAQQWLSLANGRQQQPSSPTGPFNTGAAGPQPGAAPPAQQGGVRFAPAEKAEKEPRAPNLETKGFTDKGEPITFNPSTGEYTVGKAIPGVASPAGSGAAGQGKQMTPNERAEQVRKTMDTINQLQGEEDFSHSMRTKLAAAVKNGSIYVDDKGKITPLKTASNSDVPTAQALVEEMRQRYASVTDHVKNVIRQKNDTASTIGQTPKVSTEEAIAAIDQGTKEAGILPAAVPAAGNQQTPPPQSKAPQPPQTVAATAAPAAKTANPYIVGRSYRGMKYLGGDPSAQASWGQ